MPNYKEVVKNTTITFRLMEEDKERLKEIVAERNYKSLSTLMEEIIQEYLMREA